MKKREMKNEIDVNNNNNKKNNLYGTSVDFEDSCPVTKGLNSDIFA